MIILCSWSCADATHVDDERDEVPEREPAVAISSRRRNAVVGWVVGMGK